MVECLHGRHKALSMIPSAEEKGQGRGAREEAGREVDKEGGGKREGRTTAGCTSGRLPMASYYSDFKAYLH